MLAYVRYDQSDLNWNWQGFLIILLLNLFVVALAFQYQAITSEAREAKNIANTEELRRKEKISRLYPKE